MPKSRKLVQQALLPLSDLLTIGYCAAASIEIVRPAGSGYAGLAVSPAVAQRQQQLQEFTASVEFLFFVARSLIASTGQTAMPQPVAAEIYRLWSTVRAVTRVEQHGEMVNMIVRFTCRRLRLSSAQWRRLTTYATAHNIGAIGAPGPVSQRMLGTALDSPNPKIREIGTLLLAPRVVPLP